MSKRWFMTAIAVGLTVALAMAGAQAQEKVVRLMTTETDPKTQAALKDIIAEFEKANPGVRSAPSLRVGATSTRSSSPRSLRAILPRSSPYTISTFSSWHPRASSDRWTT